MSRLILLVTTDIYLKEHIKPLGDIYIVQSIDKGVQIAKAETFDLIVVGPPFSSEEKAVSIQHNHLYIINTPDDLKKLLDYCKTETAPEMDKPEATVPPIQESIPEITTADNEEELYEYAILLVTTRKETIFILSRFNLAIVTSSYSAQQYKEAYDAIVWDITGDPPSFKRPVYIWNKDINNTNDLLGYLKPGQMSIQPGNQEGSLPFKRDIRKRIRSEDALKTRKKVFRKQTYYPQKFIKLPNINTVLSRFPQISLPKSLFKKIKWNELKTNAVLDCVEINPTPKKVRQQKRLSKQRMESLVANTQETTLDIKDIIAMLWIPLITISLVGGSAYIIFKLIIRS